MPSLAESRRKYLAVTVTLLVLFRCARQSLVEVDLDARIFRLRADHARWGLGLYGADLSPGRRAAGGTVHGGISQRPGAA